MPNEEKIEKLSKLGSVISSWKGIAVSVILLIASITTLYYQIQTNSTTNVKQDIGLKDYKKSVDKEFETWASRSDKRYIRAMEEAVELHKHIDQLNQELLKHTKEIWYIKGKLEEQDKNK